MADLTAVKLVEKRVEMKAVKLVDCLADPKVELTVKLKAVWKATEKVEQKAVLLDDGLVELSDLCWD